MRLLSRELSKLAATCALPIALVMVADAFGGCTSVDTEPATASSSSSSKASSAASTSTGMGGVGPTTVVSSSSAGGTGGSGGQGGSGGGMPACKNQDTGADTCPGDTLTLDPDFSDCFDGDTSTAKNDYQSAYCPPEATTGPDRVYHLVFKKTGSFKLKVKSLAKDFQPIMHVRGAFQTSAVCTDMTNHDLTCINFYQFQQALVQEINPADFPDLYVIVDGANGKGGKYQLLVSHTTPKCGDGVINDSLMEQCDDANTVSGDGCDKNCKFETIGVFDACPGEPFSIAANQTLTFSSNTAPYKNDYKAKAQGTCGNYAVNSKGQDRVYQLKAKADGVITASVGYDATGNVNICDNDPTDPGCWQYNLYALDALNPDTCGMSCTCDTGTQLACADQGIFQPQQITFPVKNNHSYFLVVDGDDSIFPAFGPFNLRVTLK